MGPSAPLISPYRATNQTLTRRRTSQRSIQRIDQGLVTRALPTRDDMVHDIAEGNTTDRVGEAHRSPRAEVAEAARIGAEGATRHRGFEAEPEGDVVVEDRAVPGGLRRRRFGQQVGREESTGLEERLVQARHAPG